MEITKSLEFEGESFVKTIIGGYAYTHPQVPFLGNGHIFEIELPTGEYWIEITGLKGSNFGILSWYVDGTLICEQDWFYYDKNTQAAPLEPV